MEKPALVVMAAGMGSRYGGLKQIDPVGPNGEKIIDYSIYDALKAGFGKVVFVVKKDFERKFRQDVGSSIEKLVDTEYVFQELDYIPEGLDVPAGRVKPWGTAHAVMCCKNAVSTPFAVINADDYYGRMSFKVICDYLTGLKDTRDTYQYCMVGFVLENTVTENGHVARGVCEVDDNGYLRRINERTRIEKHGDVIEYTVDGQNWTGLPRDSVVSMNLWGLTPGVFMELEERFSSFLSENRDNIDKAEYFLPSVVDRMIVEKKAVVKVLHSTDRWYGVTYREDKPVVRRAISALIEEDVYPGNLWENEQNYRAMGGYVNGRA